MASVFQYEDKQLDPPTQFSYIHESQIPNQIQNRFEAQKPPIATTYSVSHSEPCNSDNDTHHPLHGEINDPLDWSPRKKHSVLLSLAAASLLCDWGMTWGTTLFEAQAEEWQMTVTDVVQSISGGIFMQGPGGVLAVPLTQRLPILFWSQLLTTIVVFAAALSPSYGAFTACRTLQGLFNTAPQVIGLSIVRDMFFFHERTRKINLWALSFFSGPFLGPFLSGLLVGRLSWRACYGILAGLHGAALVIIVLLGEETLYDRPVGEIDCGLEMNRTMQSGPHTLTLSSASIAQPRSQSNRFFRLIGHAPPTYSEDSNIRNRPTLLQAVKSTLHVGVLPQLLLPAAVFITIDFMWAIGIITTVTQIVKPPPYLFSDFNVALLYLAPLTGVIIGEVWGHWWNDILQTRSIHKHHGVHKPEDRLWGCYPAVFASIVGLVTYGQTVQHSLHWAGLAVGWGLVAAGFMITTTAVSSYAVDVFPLHAAQAAGWVNFWRTTGGFCVSYFQIQWMHYSGAGIAFGCQAGIVAGAFLAIIATQIWGERWRNMFRKPQPEN